MYLDFQNLTSCLLLPVKNALGRDLTKLNYQLWPDNEHDFSEYIIILVDDKTLKIANILVILRAGYPVLQSQI